MSDQQGPSSQSDPNRTVAPKKGPTRRFFHSIQPTFSIAQPSTRIEFLDNSDPSKDVIVRKKAREWVHRNKEREMATKRKQSKKSEKGEVEHVWEIEKGGARSRQIKMVSDPLMHLAGARPDPFDVLPAVGRKVDHIIEYFLTSCPEEIPCSDDKYAWRPRDLAVQPSRNNSILGTMSGEYVSFVLWLHATTLIRDGVAGNWDSEEMAYYYKLSLKVMQEASKRKVEQYTDEFICSLACFTACANFSGMFKASIVHNNAMMRAIALRGGGDLLAGFLKCKAWTRKAVQWCEFGVAAQNRALPKLPYQPPPLTDPLPDSEMADADCLTATTLSSIPPVSKTISDIFRLLHQLGVTQAHPPLKYHAAPRKKKMDPCVIRPLYDAEYTLLQVLSSQQTPSHTYSEVEIMLTEACQLYLWTGPRGLPPEMKMCDLFVVWLQKALLPLLKQTRRVYTSGFTPPALLSEGSADTACSEQTISSDSSVETTRRLSKLENAVLWGLYLGTVASRAHYRPEFEWYREHFRFQMQAAGLKTKDDLRRILSLFPYVDDSDWLGMHKLEFDFKTSENEN